MKLRFTHKQQEAGDVWSFYFDTLEPLEWLAGQSIRLELKRPTWGVDERRFTIASAPFEGHIRITTRVGESNFKQSLMQLKKGSEINGYNIEGDFLWQDDGRPRLMLAAGIGITPFRALLKQAAHDKQPLNTTLLYSSHKLPAVFQEELEALRTKDSSLFIRYLAGERIAIAPDSSLPRFWLESTVYVSGPDEMVGGVSRALLQQGLSPEQLRTDVFTGI